MKQYKNRVDFPDTPSMHVINCDVI